MYCQICEPLVKLVKTDFTANYNEKEDVYTREYCCPNCNTLYECTSQSGDMVQENLNIIE